MNANPIAAPRKRSARLHRSGHGVGDLFNR
jgi:hypothetical protein